MNKIFVGIAIVAAIAIAWFILNPGNTFDYVVTMEQEVTALESELAKLEAAVTASALSESEATEAKVQILTRLNSINTAATASEKAQLTPAQRAQLVEGLDRLKTILVTYQATLATVDAAADDTAVEALMATKTRTRSVQNSGNRPLNLVVADVIADVEVTVADSVQDYEANEELDVEIEEIVTEVEAEVAAEEAAEAEMTDEEATTTDETTSSEMDDLDSDLGGSMDTMDAATEVDADADLEATTTN